MFPKFVGFTRFPHDIKRDLSKIGFEYVHLSERARIMKDMYQTEVIIASSFDHV